MAEQDSSDANFDQQYRGPAVGPSYFITFADCLNIYHFQHAVGIIGQRSLFLVLDNLIQGDMNQIMTTVRNALGSNTALTKHFSDPEILRLEQGNPLHFDVTLMYKVDQIVCGLAPMNSGQWARTEDGIETLETLLYQLKQMRNQVSHSFPQQMMSDHHLESALEGLRSLAMRIIGALVSTSEDRGNVIETDVVEGFEKFVEDVLTDALQLTV